jgi:hypothetical protein
MRSAERATPPHGDNPAMPATSRLVQRLGLAIAALGLVAALAVYATAAADPDADPLAQQREMRELARLEGSAGVQTVKFDAWLSSLWHGERLAFTLAVIGLAIGGACWRIGGLMGEDDLAD